MTWRAGRINRRLDDWEKIDQKETDAHTHSQPGRQKETDRQAGRKEGKNNNNRIRSGDDRIETGRKTDR